MTDGADPERDTDPAGPVRRPVDFEPPWREARRRVTTAWARGGTPTRVALGLAIVVAAGLLGAFLFGLWHVVVGGLVNGNWNAAGFGFALASVAGAMLWIEAAIARRLLPGRRIGPPPQRSVGGTAQVVPLDGEVLTWTEDEDDGGQASSGVPRVPPTRSGFGSAALAEPTGDGEGVTTRDPQGRPGT